MAKIKKKPGPHDPITCSVCGTQYTLAGFGQCPYNHEPKPKSSLVSLESSELGERFLKEDRK